MNKEFFTEPLTSLCATLCDFAGVTPPGYAAPASAELKQKLVNQSGLEKVDRILMYNPDAVADYIYDRYYDKFAPLEKTAPVRQRFITVYPPKTPVCFASMYTGATPDKHGITKYEKPVVKIESIFDAFIKAGKKPCIVSVKNQSMDKIFRGRDMAYFSETYDDAVVARALELMEKDEYDLLCVYNQRYDDAMHRSHPNSKRSQYALDCYAAAFKQLSEKVDTCWQKHDTLIGFAPDHGVHRMIIGLGNHGSNIPKDMNISHLYGIIPKKI